MTVGSRANAKTASPCLAVCLTLEVVGATVDAAVAAHEESGGSRHNSSGRRGARYFSKKGFKRVKDIDGQNWKDNSRSR